MSVESKVYLGVYVDIKDYVDKMEIDVYDGEYERLSCGHEDEEFEIINDGMSGEYCYFGFTLHVIEEMYCNNFCEVDVSYIIDMKFRVVAKMHEFGIEVKDSPMLLMFTHSY